MALIVYPETNWNSYISLEDAETLISDRVLDTSSWDLLDNTTKEKYLLQSTLLIKNKIDSITYSETPYNLMLAVIYLATYSVGKDMTTNVGDDNVKVLEIDGAIKKEYFTRGKKSNSFPSIASELLIEFGFRSSGTFSIERS